MSEKIQESISETEDTAETLTENITDSDAPVADTTAEETVVEPDEDLLETPESDKEPTVAELQEELVLAQNEAAKNLEGWQRAVADLKNHKRRQEEQASTRIFNLKATIIKDVLPALDDLDLAFQNLPEGLNEQEANWVEGFKLVQRKLLKLLENNSISTIESTGEFDPNLHEAVTYEENPDYESNAIIAELRKGYIAGDRVLRPALVRVAR